MRCAKIMDHMVIDDAYSFVKLNFAIHPLELIFTALEDLQRADTALHRQGLPFCCYCTLFYLINIDEFHNIKM